METCADSVVDTLLDGGLSVCFANPGTTEMFLVSALEKKRASMRSVLCLHEAVCTGACDGYARLTGKPAVALLHLGPGLGNGLCNLHNAHRARSPVCVLVGEHATWHKAADPPLAQHIQALAATVSGSVLTIGSPEAASSTIQQALETLATPAPPSSSADAAGGAATGGSAAEAASATGGTQAVVTTTRPSSRVVTIVLPHDVSWAPAAVPQSPAGASSPSPSTAAAAAAAAASDGSQAAATSSSSSSSSSTRRRQPVIKLSESPAAQQFLADCAAAMRAAPRGKVALVLGGAALLAEGNALPNAGRIAAALGAALLCDPLPGRITRGAGLPHCTRLPYFPQEASAELAKFDVVLLLDIKRPVATFGYKDGPSQLLSQPDDNKWELDGGLPVAEALQSLVQLVPGAQQVQPGINCGGRFAAASVPPLPAGTGRLTAASLCQALAALQPPDCVLVDESLTSGAVYWEVSKGCAAFDHLCLTGGAIGSGPPMATGAAVAAPARQVINLQADGSAMYTLQALWSQARERLKVLTIICANNTYAILKVEAMRQRVPGSSNSLTSLAGPAIDWVALASGMGVPAGRAESVQQLQELVQKGLQQQGPFLIHAALA